MTAPAHSDALPAGTRLLWYEVQRVLGRGGFAITYLAIDTHLQQQVAIKEYLPLGLALRADGGVHAKTGSEQTFAWGRERFLAEARTLARFKHPNIVRVVSFFEAHNTAYLVMDFEAGQSLTAYLASHPAPDLKGLKAIILPLMDGLEELHRSGFIHRDIKPDNIYLRADGSPVLLDFGAARQALSDRTQNLTALLSPGYAPLEQYFSEKDKQGPWSDIYALAAVMYRAISGKKPAEATLRSNALLNGQPDPLTPLAHLAMGRYPLPFLRAIDQALRLREQERPRSLREWRAQLEAPTGEVAATLPLDTTPLNVAPLDIEAPRTAPGLTAPPRTIRPTRREPAAASKRRLPVIALLVGVTGAAIAYKANQRPPSAPPGSAPATLAAPAPAVGLPAPAEVAPPPPAPEPTPALAPLPPPAPVHDSATALEAPSPAPPRRDLAPPRAIPDPVSEPIQARFPPRPEFATHQPTNRPLDACRGELESYCGEVAPGDRRFATCLRDNLHRLSERCRQVVGHRLRDKPLHD